MFGKTLLLTVALFILSAAKPGPITDDAEKLMHRRAERPSARNDFPVNPDELEKDFWWNDAQNTLLKRRNAKLNTNIARNVIMFLGDGMSISTLKAARVYLGQSNGEDGERTKLAMEDFPYSGLSKTYCVDAQTPDSACTATAYLAGVKTNDGMIGVSARVNYGNCTANLDDSQFVYSIAKWSQDAGKRTGVVTTTRITHASPAGTYAHVADRDWESDYDTPDGCSDIALQFVHGETGKNINVALGGGRRNFKPNSRVDEEGNNGRRRDGKDLVQEWLDSKNGKTVEYVWNRDGLLNIPKDTEYVLGLFESTHMQYYLDARDNPNEPTLPEMTEAAIKLLSEGDKGYFLFVEGGQIDFAHHDNLPQRSLSEAIQFSEAIQRAVDLTNEEDTLIIVTSDHSHVFTVSGYPYRGTDILGIAGIGGDGISYPVLSYANGPGYRQEVEGVRYDFSQSPDFHDVDRIYPSMVPRNSETHSGEEVGIFARGPWAHLFSGVIEQNVIPHIMAFASCVGDGVQANACRANIPRASKP